MAHEDRLRRTLEQEGLQTRRPYEGGPVLAALPGTLWPRLELRHVDGAWEIRAEVMDALQTKLGALDSLGTTRQLEERRYGYGLRATAEKAAEWLRALDASVRLGAKP